LSFGLYLLGFLFLTVGLVYGATLMHVPSHWIAVLVLIMVGLAIVKGVRTTRPKDSA
jgi:putative Mn2+ efflux pump MntP